MDMAKNVKISREYGGSQPKQQDEARLYLKKLFRTTDGRHFLALSHRHFASCPPPTASYSKCTHNYRYPQLLQVQQAATPHLSTLPTLPTGSGSLHSPTGM